MNEHKRQRHDNCWWYQSNPTLINDNMGNDYDHYDCDG